MRISRATGLLAWIACSLHTMAHAQLIADESQETAAVRATNMPTDPPTQLFETMEDLHIPENLTKEELEASTCQSKLRPFKIETEGDRLLRVAVHSIRSAELDREQYTALFSDYLTKTAGRRFDPPLEFEIVPLTFEEIMATASRKSIDFVFANPSIYSCLGAEIGASALATVVSRQVVRDRVYDLDVYAGVMFALAKREDIKTIEDFQEKIIGRGALGDLAGGQLQFYEMVKAGLSFALEPKQIVIAPNQDEVVKGVLDGIIDVGFVRTNQIEGYVDSDGEHLDPSLLRIIEPQVHILDDGDIFPFIHSTDTYPEWPFATLAHVSPDIMEEVQDALLALGRRAEAAQGLEDCPSQTGMTVEQCDELPFPDAFSDDARCDSTKEIAFTALNATRLSQKSAFRPIRSYFDVRTMQEASGVISKNDQGKWQCRRSSELYHGVGCPSGYWKVSAEEFYSSCERKGLTCKAEWSCFCRPCIYQVNIHQVRPGDTDVNLCEHEQICGRAEQGETMILRATDNMERVLVRARAVLTIGDKVQELPVARIHGTFYHDIQITHHQVGSGIVEVYFDDEKLVQSPFPIQVLQRNCSIGYPGEGRAPDENGRCICSSDSFEIGGKCVAAVVLFSVVSSVVILAILVGVYFYARHKRKISDRVWIVNPEDLHFGEPPEIIGQGSFGVVVLAEYRGTKVAIKSVLPPSSNAKRRGGSKLGSKLLSSVDSDSKTAREYLTGSKADEYVHPNDDANSDVYLGGVSSVDGDSSVSYPLDASGAETPDLERGNKSAALSQDNLKTLTRMSFGIEQSFWARLCPGLFRDDHAKLKSDILGSISGTTTNRHLVNVIFPCFDAQHQQKEAFMLEMRLLSKLRHPCITTVMGAVVSNFHDPMLVMEYMEYGSLHDLLQNETMYTGGDVLLQILRDIAQGLRYLHSSRPPICHGDLKARNILIDSRFRAKVADFGLSTKKKNSLTGTPYFMAPEYLRGNSRYTPACDMYSVGMLLYETYSRQDPYAGENVMEVLKKVCDPRVKKRPPVPELMPAKMADVMKKCWSADPTYRPQAKELDMMLMDMSMQDAEPLTREMINNGGREKPKTVDMLYEVFPRHIADALKAGRKVESETHDMVTVFFSDIVGFTDISRKMSSLKVCQMLERLYEEFDKLARAYKVFKVETIGDAYMGVTNLEGTQDRDHVKVIAEFALAAIDAASKVLIDEEDPSKGCIRIRVGFHSGPVVSNVIGSLNPRYGLFGDTVNTASRMESNSIEGRILCSEASAHLLMKQDPKLLVRKRGKVEVKGKGEMMTYWVLKSKNHKLSHGLNETGQILEDAAKVKDYVADTLQDLSPLERRNGADAKVESTPQEQAPAKPAILQAHENLIKESVQYTPPMEQSLSSPICDC